MSKTKTEAFELAARAAMYTGKEETTRAFFLTYTEYLPSDDYTLVPFWVDEFEKVLEKEKVKVRITKESHPHKLLRFLDIWISAYPGDFNKKDRDLVRKLIKSHKRKYPVIKSILKMLDTSPSSRGSVKKAGSMVVVDDVFNYSPKEIAKELTRIDWDLFQKCNPREFVDQSVAPNLRDLADRFNRVSYWVSTEICGSIRRRDQVRAIKLFIELTYACVKMNNFNTGMAIFNGLNSPSVERLTKAWAPVSTSSMKKWEEICLLFSVKNNYKNYHAAISERKPPILPYVPLLLRNIAFIKDGNSLYLESGRVNIERGIVLQNEVISIQKYQEVPFKIGPPKKKNIHQFLKNLQHLSEDEIYSLSVESQPSKHETAPLSALEIRSKYHWLPDRCVKDKGGRGSNSQGSSYSYRSSQSYSYRSEADSDEPSSSGKRLTAVMSAEIESTSPKGEHGRSSMSKKSGLVMGSRVRKDSSRT